MAMSSTSGSRAIEIAATVSDCYSAIVDFETYPDWQSVIEEAEVIATDREGRGELVRYRIDTKLRPIGYVLRYRHLPPDRLEWVYEEGDIGDVSGSYTFERAEEMTRATFELTVDPGFWVPGPLLRRVGAATLEKSLAELKERAESNR